MNVAYGLQSDPFEAISEILNSPYVRTGFWIVAAFFVVLWLSLAYWTFVDADGGGRCASSGGWWPSCSRSWEL